MNKLTTLYILGLFNGVTAYRFRKQLEQSLQYLGAFEGEGTRIKGVRWK